MRRIRTTRESTATASIAVRPDIPASLEISAKLSTRPLRSVTTPANALMAVSEPVLARNHPAGPEPAGVPSRKRSDSVPLPPAIGNKSSSGRSVG